jgi:beta-lactamase class A
MKRIARIFAMVGCMVLAANLFGQANSGTEAAQKQKVLWSKLGSAIEAIDQQLDGVLGVAIEDLTTGQKFLLREDEVFPQASSIKIAILAELYQQSQLPAGSGSHRAQLSDLYTFQPSDLVADSDIMQGLTPSVTRLTNRDLATMMVAVSDNSAANVLIDRVGMDNVNSLLESLGLSHTRLRRKMMDLRAASEGRENVSTPREMMLLLEKIYHGKVLNPEMTKDFLKVLSTHKDSWIPRNLPEGIQIANKPGSLEGVRNDSGIVFASRPYVICVMTAYLSNERDGEDAISRISAAAYRLFDRLGRASELGRVVSPRNSAR